MSHGCGCACVLLMHEFCPVKHSELVAIYHPKSSIIRTSWWFSRGHERYVSTDSGTFAQMVVWHQPISHPAKDHMGSDEQRVCNHLFLHLPHEWLMFSNSMSNPCLETNRFLVNGFASVIEFYYKLLRTVGFVSADNTNMFKHAYYLWVYILCITYVHRYRYKFSIYIYIYIIYIYIFVDFICILQHQIQSLFEDVELQASRDSKVQTEVWTHDSWAWRHQQ